MKIWTKYYVGSCLKTRYVYIKGVYLREALAPRRKSRILRGVGVLPCNGSAAGVKG